MRPALQAPRLWTAFDFFCKQDWFSAAAELVTDETATQHTHPIQTFALFLTVQALETSVQLCDCIQLCSIVNNLGFCILKYYPASKGETPGLFHTT